MRAMVLEKARQPLVLREVLKPKPKAGQLLVRVSACAVCRTDLHIVDGELPDPKLPLILGHQIVGRVEKIGEGANPPSAIRTLQFKIGDRIGIPWLGWTDGDYGEFVVADARFCFHLPDQYDDVDLAPLLCAGMLGYRSYRKMGDERRLGLYGFGNAARLIAQVALYQGREVFAFTRPGDKAGQEAARKLGARWAGGSY